MSTYTVQWTIEVEADSAKGAAAEALKIQRDPDSIATVFRVSGGEGSEITGCAGLRIDAKRSYCRECKEQADHDTCGMNEGCPCCDDTAAQMARMSREGSF